MSLLLLNKVSARPPAQDEAPGRSLIAMVGGESRADNERDHRSSTRPAFRGTYVVIGVAFAIAAIVALISTDDAHVLRLVILIALWAFVFAVMAARPGRRRELSTAREIGLRHSYERRLEREIAARRDQQIGLELYLRRELEAGLHEGVWVLRGEVDELRGAIIQRLAHELPVDETEPSPTAETSPDGRQRRDDQRSSSREADGET